MSRTSLILRSLVGGARLFGVWWRQEFDKSAASLLYQHNLSILRSFSNSGFRSAYSGLSMAL
jgi:hypothetical protein